MPDATYIHARWNAVDELAPQFDKPLVEGPTRELEQRGPRIPRIDEELDTRPISDLSPAQPQPDNPVERQLGLLKAAFERQ